MRELHEARGDRELKDSGCHDLMHYIMDFKYENTLLIWHVATEICFNIEEVEDVNNDDDRKRKRTFGKKLSDYMAYLLVRRPELVSAVAGTSQIRCKDTEIELMEVWKKEGALTMREFCESIVREKTNINKCTKEVKNHALSVLKDSSRLAQQLSGKTNRWEVIYNVWLELLMYAAGHCRVDLHIRLLSEGSEFLTIIWMLMALCGIRDQFASSEEEDKEQIEESLN